MYHILYPENDEHKIEGTNKNWDFLRLYFILPKMMKGKSKKNIKLGISYYILYPQYDGKKIEVQCIKYCQNDKTNS